MLEYIVKLVLGRGSEPGQALAEYSLVLAFIAMVCVLALGLLGLTLAVQIDSITAGFP
jgi:Flp pilus assembly pilin Flp